MTKQNETEGQIKSDVKCMSLVTKMKLPMVRQEHDAHMAHGLIQT